MDVGATLVKVETNPCFNEQYLAFDMPAQQAIARFVEYVEQYGLRGLIGRNKPSIPKSLRTKRQRADFAYAQKHCLWHYHIGIPEYVGEAGDMTSEYILHYQRFDDRIVLVGLSAHPPFELPTISH